MISLDILEKNLRSLNDEQMNQILDLRDSSFFENELLKLDDALSDVDLEFDGEERFIKLSNATSGHEICSYIIEDIEMIEKALLINYQSPLVVYLMRCYESGKVPYELPLSI